jgi:hypothetical protein
MPSIDATASVRRLENERGDRLRRTAVVFRVDRPVWQLSVASAFCIVALVALGASASAALAACNDQTNNPWGIAGVHCSRSLMVAGADWSIIVDFLAGGPMLSITVLADWDVTSVRTDAAAAAVWKGSVGVR